MQLLSLRQGRPCLKRKVGRGTDLPPPFVPCALYPMDLRDALGSWERIYTPRASALESINRLGLCDFLAQAASLAGTVRSG